MASDGGVEDRLIGPIEGSPHGAREAPVAGPVLLGVVEAGLDRETRCHLSAAVSAETVRHGEHQAHLRGCDRLFDGILLRRRDEGSVAVERGPTQPVLVVVPDVTVDGQARVLDGQRRGHGLHLSGDEADIGVDFLLEIGRNRAWQSPADGAVSNVRTETVTSPGPPPEV